MTIENANPEDRGDDFTPTGDDAVTPGVTDEDLDEEAETLAELRASQARIKAEEDAENKKVVEGEKKPDEKKVDDKKPEGKVEDEKKVDDKKVDDDEKKPEPRIPLSRHKQLLEQERARTAEATNRMAEALKTGNREQVQADTAKDEAKIGELEEKYNKHLADGEVKEATALMKEIRTIERGISDRTRREEIAAVEERTVERMRFDTTVSQLEAAYPQINPDHESYDTEVVKEVLEMQGAWVKTGLLPSLALQKAVKYVLKPATAAQVVATELKKEDDAADAKDPDGAAERKAAATAKAVDAANKQPANVAKIGLDSDKAGGGAVDAKAVMKMSQADFAKLGEEELSKLRGDAL